MISRSAFSYLWVLILDYGSLLKLKFKIKDLVWSLPIFNFLKFFFLKKTSEQIPGKKKKTKKKPPPRLVHIKVNENI